MKLDADVHKVEAREACQNCGKHVATVAWVGGGGFLAFTHGHYQNWCRCCVLGASIDYAREQAARIPELERELAEVRCEEAK